MPWGLQRFQQSRQSHFVIFGCYHRRPSFTTDAPKQIFENALERIRSRFGIYVYGYVVMPEHVHLLLSEPGGLFNAPGGPLKPSFGLSGDLTLADAIKSLKQGVSRRLIGEAETLLAKTLLRFQYPESRAVCGEASLHPPQSCEERTVRTPRRLGVEQFSPLRNRLRRTSGD
jgi:putative transposase